MSARTEAEQILTGLGFAPEINGMDYAVKGLADRLARTERALDETRRMVDEAAERGAVRALRDADAALLDLRDSLRHKRERHSWPLGVEDAARKVRSLANAAEVTL